MARRKTPEARAAEAIGDKLDVLARVILAESGASGIRISVDFTYHVKAGGRIKLSMGVTPDAVNERVGCGPVRPIGSALQDTAEEKLRKIIGEAK